MAAMLGIVIEICLLCHGKCGNSFGKVMEFSFRKLLQTMNLLIETVPCYALWKCGGYIVMLLWFCQLVCILYTMLWWARHVEDACSWSKFLKLE